MKISEEERAILRDWIPRRMPIMILELAWALGAPNPGFVTEPPRWVAKAIRRALPDLAEASQIAPCGKCRGESDIELQGRLLGKTQVALADFRTEDPVEQKMAAQNPHLNLMRDALRIFIENQGPLELKLRKPLTVSETVKFQKAAAVGADSAAREMDGNTTMTREICNALWLYWPIAAAAANRKEMKDFLHVAARLRCETKLFEKICNEIEYHPAKRGRPTKNPTLQRERVGIKKTHSTLKSGHDQSRPPKKPTGQARPHQRRSR